jgi:DNA-binding transcriptional MocR family regulator
MFSRRTPVSRKTNSSYYDTAPGPYFMSEEKKEEPSALTKVTMSSGRAALLARPNVLSLEPYRCARDDYDTGILLDANENAYGPTSLPTNSLDPYDNGMLLERYPCPYQRDVKQLLCDYRNAKSSVGGSSSSNITPENVFCGVGSDEAIDLLIRIFCKPGKEEGGDAIMITPPTYGMYKVCANVNDVTIQSIPLTSDFDLRVPEVCRYHSLFLLHSYTIGSMISDKFITNIFCAAANNNNNTNNKTTKTQDVTSHDPTYKACLCLFSR